MSTFQEYYRAYLGLHEPNQHTATIIVESENRDFPLNQKYVYPVIATSLNGSMICSASPHCLEICQRIFDGSSASIMVLYEEMNKPDNHFELRRLRRYSIGNQEIILKTNAIELTPQMIQEIEFSLTSNPIEYIQKKADVLKDHRQFAILKDNKIVSTAFISEIQYKGCNIVVYTDPQFRHEGYGREVVKACINWCNQRQLLPIYLVDERNALSIQLAESVGMSLESTEWSIADMKEQS